MREKAVGDMTAAKQQGASKDKVGPGNPPKHSRWKKGQSGNPKGRPPGVCITSAFRRALENGSTVDDFAADLLARAREGNSQAIKQIMDRIDGPVETKVDVTSGGEKLKYYVGISPEEFSELSEGDGDDGDTD